MATHARTSAKIKKLGVSYIVRHPAHIDPDGKGDRCPSCKARNTLKFVDEEIQLGFISHKYFEYLACSECGENVVVIIMKKADRYDA